MVATAGESQTIPDEKLDFENWQTFHERVELLLGSGAASSDALKILRSQIEDSRATANGHLLPLEQEILEINQRLAAIADSEAKLGARSEILESLRASLLARLVTTSEQFFIAEEIIKQSSSDLERISELLSQRASASIRSRVTTPLLPANWADAAGFVSSRLAGAVFEISNSLESATQRKAARENLPDSLLWFALGALLLFPLRGRVMNLVRRLPGKVLSVSDFAVQQLACLIANVFCPLGAVYALVRAVESTDLLFFNSQAFFAAIPGAALAFLVASWLARTLEHDSGKSVFSIELEAGQAQALRSSGVALAGLLALWVMLATVARSGSAQVNATLQFPVLLLTGYCLYRIGQLLLKFAVIANRSGEISVSRFQMQALLARIAMIVPLVAGAFAVLGYSTGSSYLMYSTIKSLLAIGTTFVMFKILMGIYVIAATLLNDHFLISIRGPASLVIGLLVLIGGMIAVALSWGLSAEDLLRYLAWSQQGVEIGGISITIGSVVTLVVVLVVGIALTRLAQVLLRNSVLPNTNLDRGAQTALVTTGGYAGIGLSIIAAIVLAGFDLTNLAIIAGALSVGIGFGLQTIVSNFVSGIILLSERPINEGDWIECGSVVGTVRKVSVRSTHIETFDKATVVVPNSDLLSSQLQNWTLGNTLGRVTLPVGVAYGTDPERVQRILLEIAEEEELVVADPEPFVVFKSFGSDALEFQLRVYLKDISHILDVTTSVNLEICKRFAREGIEIPFPQRDIWLKNPEALNVQNPRKLSELSS